MRLKMPMPGKVRSVVPENSVGPVAVVCPTMGRPEQCKRLVESFLATSVGATLFLIFSQEQDIDTYKEAGALPDHPRLHWATSNYTGGPVQICEGTIRAIGNPFTIFGMVPDDCEFRTVGWDEWLDKAFDKFPKRIGCISAHHNFGRVVNFPWVTRRWIETVGWYWYTKNFHYCCDTIIEIIAECSNSIYYCKPEEFDIMHYHEPSMNREKMDHDLWNMFDFIIFERRELVDRVKSVQNDTTSSFSQDAWSASL